MMVFRLAIAVVVLAGFSVHLSWAIPSFRAIDVLNRHQKDEEMLASNDVQELAVQQPLDHFDRRERRTLKQRYFYSNRFVNVSFRESFAFLCVGGEGPALDSSVLVDSVHCTGDMLELASILFHGFRVSIHLFALEHRYYGKSVPVFCNNTADECSPYSNSHLQFLSSRQALADLASFVKLQNSRFMITKWITFGGSYPGMLSAWVRKLYPELIYAAVSNSAPIQATLDFYQYKQRVGLDTRYHMVGGSNECFEILTQGHSALAAMLQDENSRKEAGDLFNVCNAESSFRSERNVDLFVGDGVVEIPAQDNDPSCSVGLCSIEQLCSFLIEESRASDPLQALLSASRIQSYNVHECTVVDWNSTLEYLSSPHRAQQDRSWLWQSCTEFGFFQTCRDGCPFGRGQHLLSSDLQICRQAFGIENTKQLILDTREHYGGWKMPNATRILAVNGDVDPWSVLAYQGDSNDLPSYWVKGASHHFWTHKVKESDDGFVKEARQAIYQVLIAWLFDYIGDEPEADIKNS